MSHFLQPYSSPLSFDHDPLLLSYNQALADATSYLTTAESEPSHSFDRQDNFNWIGDDYFQDLPSTPLYEDASRYSPSRYEVESFDQSGDEIVDEEEESESGSEASDYDDLRCTTPESYDIDEWEKNQDLPHDERRNLGPCEEFDDLDLEYRGSEEFLFSRKNDHTQFDIVQPFGAEPMYETLSFPVENHVILFISRKFPLYKDWWKLQASLEEFNEVAQDLAFRGDKERLPILLSIASIRTGLEQDFVEEPNDIYYEYRHARFLRMTANAENGATPTGRHLPQRPIRLFEEEKAEGEREVKRRRLDLEDI